MCKDQCSSNCLNALDCDHVTGACNGGCLAGWTGPRCDRTCAENYFGSECQQQCGNCKNGDVCNHVTGLCPTGCAEGWIGSRCNIACQFGYYGQSCKETCSEHCRHANDCDHVTGVCSNGCFDGWLGKYCNQINLALGKHADISSRAHFWSRPELANDGDGGQVDTKCTQTVGNDTEAWWQVDLQGASILSVQITYAENSADTMAGFSVYVSDNSTHFRNGHLCFHHNASSLPALILEFQCRVHGRYFTFYNERRQDVKYPEAYSTYAIVELCEVEILGCERDEGGFTCLPCSTSCKDEACDIETSECLQCYDGYRGPDCTLACPGGYYGPTCDNPCSDRCKSPGQCDSVTGHCVGGCIDGWIGKLCTQQCPQGRYGKTCSLQCKNCINQLSCNHISGSCKSGCSSGWMGDRCNQSESKIYNRL
uniref:Multiple epidermal growth factor-like domains 6 n=1 Tax=Magallana gigas TaxID=29159 RepID=K1PD74_MAGGI